MDVSIIIPTFNKLPRLKLTLASIEMQSYPKDQFEVILIDDGSTDGTRSFLEEYRADFNLKCFTQENQGRSGARNSGIKLAVGELIIFMDDDLILHPEFIQTHVDEYRKKPKVVHGRIVNLTYLKFFQDPTNGILYSYLQMKDSSVKGLKSKCISEDDIRKEFNKCILPNNKMTNFELAVREIFLRGIDDFQWLGFTGGNVSVPREWLEKVGGFEESFGLKWGCEDFELGYRLHLEGYPFEYCETAINYHMVHYRPDMELQIHDTIENFYNKYSDPKILLLEDFLTEKISRDSFISLLLEYTQR